MNRCHQRLSHSFVSHRTRADSAQPVYYPEQITPEVEQDGDRTTVRVYDPHNEVRTAYRTGPTHEITDPALHQQGIGAHRMLLATGEEGEEEELFEGFKVRPYPRNFFTVGKVFLVLWSEPAGPSKTLASGFSVLQPGTLPGRYGEKVHSKVRRFVVIRANDYYCSALPITTYQGRGVGKNGVKKGEHCIIFSSRLPPQPLNIEVPARGEQGMRPVPIRIDVDNRAHRLDPVSRLDFGKVHTVQHNIKVKAYGKVNENSLYALQTQFGEVWRDMLNSTGAGTGRTVNPGFQTPLVDQRPVAGRQRRDSARSPQAGPSTGPLHHATLTAGGSGSDALLERAHSDLSDTERASQRVKEIFWGAVRRRMAEQKCPQAEAIQYVRSRMAPVLDQRASQSNDDNDDEEDDESEDDDEDDEEDQHGHGGNAR